MKIVIDTIAFSIQKIGGISVVWYEIIKRLLSDNRIEDSYLEYPNTNYYYELLDIPDKKKQVKNNFLFKLKRYINPFLLVKGPFIFHSTYYRYAKNKNAINITTIHDFTYEILGSKKSLNYYVHTYQKKKAVEHSDYIVCISENTKKDTIKFYKGIDEEKLVVIYNGISDDYIKLKHDELNNLVFPYQTYCIFVGPRRKYKNYDLVVETIKKTNFNLLLVGPPLSKEEKVKLDIELGNDRYVCLSNVSNQLLNQFYNGAFCLLYLSSYEGFGIPCLEAQKAGCPVIAFNSSSIPEVVYCKEMLVDVLDVSSVLSIIRKLHDKKYREKIVDDGIKFANNFSWDKTYKALSTLYQRAWKNKHKN